MSFHVQIFEFGFLGSGFQVLVLRFRFSGSGFWVQVFGFRFMFCLSGIVQKMLEIGHISHSYTFFGLRCSGLGFGFGFFRFGF